MPPGLGEKIVRYLRCTCRLENKHTRTPASPPSPLHPPQLKKKWKQQIARWNSCFGLALKSIGRERLGEPERWWRWAGGAGVAGRAVGAGWLDSRSDKKPKQPKTEWRDELRRRPVGSRDRFWLLAPAAVAVSRRCQLAHDGLTYSPLLRSPIHFSQSDQIDEKFQTYVQPVISHKKTRFESKNKTFVNDLRNKP